MMMIERLVFFKILIMVSVFYDFFTGQKECFGSPDRLYKIVKKEGKHKISHSQIKKWIQKQESYSLNKGLKRKFQRGRVVVEGIDDQFDIDLASYLLC